MHTINTEHTKDVFPQFLQAAARTKRDSKENDSLDPSLSSNSLASGGSSKKSLLSPSMKTDLLVREVEALRAEIAQLRESLAERQARVEELQRAQVRGLG